MGLHPTPYPYTSLHQCCSARRSNCHSMPTRTTSSLLVPAGGTAYLLDTNDPVTPRLSPALSERSPSRPRRPCASATSRTPRSPAQLLDRLEDEGIPARVIDELMGHQRSRRGGSWTVAAASAP